MIEKVKELMTSKSRKTRTLATSPSLMLSTGSTVLDLSCSGTVAGAIGKGGYYLFIGDSDSGKTVVGMNVLAEASIKPTFEDYDLVFWDEEGGAKMDLRKFFGQPLVDRVEFRKDVYVERFYDSVEDKLDAGKPFVGILDSADALMTEAEDKKAKEQKSQRRRQVKVEGEMTGGQAKLHSRNIRRILNKLISTGSILIYLNQTRENLGMGSNKTRSGGRAMVFYANLQLWMSQVETLNKSVRGKKRQIGITSRAKIRRSRFTGRKRECDFPIYHSYGIDDIGSCIDYLVDEGTWKMRKQTIICPEFGVELTKPKLIELVEREGFEFDLKHFVQDTWDAIERELVLDRKPRY